MISGMTAHEIILFAHSHLRWVVVLTSLFLCIRSFLAWRSKRTWKQADEWLHVAVVASFDTQLTLGLLLRALQSAGEGVVFTHMLPRSFVFTKVNAVTFHPADVRCSSWT